MKKIIIVSCILFFNILFGQDVTFKDLESFKNQPIITTEKKLKEKKYKYLKTFEGGIQWKATDGKGIIVFNGKGAVLFMNKNLQLHTKILKEIKSNGYNYEGKSYRERNQVEKYSKGKSKVIITTLKDPDDGKPLYSMTII